MRGLVELLGLLALVACSTSDVAGAPSPDAARQPSGGSAVSTSVAPTQGDDRGGAVPGDLGEPDGGPDGESVRGASVDEALVVVLERVGESVDSRECVSRRVPVETGLVEKIVGGGEAGDEAVLSVVRSCERVNAVADSWLGEADRTCVREELGGVPDAVVKGFQSKALNPAFEAGEAVDGLVERLERC